METIKSSAEITRLFNEGRRIGAHDLTIIVLRNQERHDQYGRAAFIAGKKLGNAVWRNRAKRRLRAVCRDLNDNFIGYDVVFMAKRSTNDVPYGLLLESARHAVERAYRENKLVSNGKE